MPTLGNVNRLYEFLRRHPTWVDGCWAFVLLLPSLAVAALPGDNYPGSHLSWVLTALVMGVVITLRRRYPEHMLLLAIAAGIGQLISGTEPVPANLAFLVITFTVASREPRWPSRLALGASLAAPTLTTLRWPESNADDAILSSIVSTLLLTVTFCLAWVLGDSLRTRRAYYAELEARAARLERERETQARMAVAAERARIARELHDVVAHNVSVMVVQADGAAYVLDAAPDQARNALHTISSTGRQALTEMRRLLGVLRTGTEATTRNDYVPQPGVAQLTELIDQVRDTGLPVDFRIDGTPRPLPSGVELTAYRIVQEALTNSRKHGGPYVGAVVRLEYDRDVLTVRAEDDGRGTRRELYQERGVDGLGHGLIGMRERVGMVGGELVAGPRPGGGFQVSATLPLAGGT